MQFFLNVIQISAIRQNLEALMKAKTAGSSGCSLLLFLISAIDSSPYHDFPSPCSTSSTNKKKTFPDFTHTHSHVVYNIIYVYATVMTCVCVYIYTCETLRPQSFSGLCERPLLCETTISARMAQVRNAWRNQVTKSSKRS